MHIHIIRIVWDVPRIIQSLCGIFGFQHEKKNFILSKIRICINVFIIIYIIFMCVKRLSICNVITDMHIYKRGAQHKSEKNCMESHISFFYIRCVPPDFWLICNQFYGSARNWLRCRSMHLISKMRPKNNKNDIALITIIWQACPAEYTHLSHTRTHAWHRGCFHFSLPQRLFLFCYFLFAAKIAKINIWHPWSGL